MLVLGIALVIVAALVEFAHLSIIGAMFLVGAGCIVLGLVVGERLPEYRRP